MRASYLKKVGHSWLVLVVAVMALMAVRCGGTTPTTPAPPIPPVTPPPPPPPAVNTPPTIKSLTSGSPRVEADESVTLVAVVEDAETPIDQLTYEWAVAPSMGTLTGTGRVVTWTAPHLQPTPDTYTITLTVVEKYTLAGEAKENKVSASVQVHYNDSYRDITRITQTFLSDFATYSMSPEQCVRHFSDNCPGKFEELRQIRQNRQLYQIVSGTSSISNVVLNRDKTFANVTASCQFQDIVKATGRREIVTGTCSLTAVYENWTWFLCDSYFSGSSTTTLRYLHP